jgi:hypothetical protein
MDPRHISLDRLEHILLRASDILCVWLGPRQQLLCAIFGFVPGCDEVRGSVLEVGAEVGVDALELRAAGRSITAFRTSITKVGRP